MHPSSFVLFRLIKCRYPCWAGITNTLGITHASNLILLGYHHEWYPDWKPNYRLEVRTGCDNWFLERTQTIWELGNVWPLTRVRVSGFSCHSKLVQARNEKGVMSIKLNYVSMQDETTFYKLDLVIIHGSWVWTLEILC
jgi:hypothetical protein